MTARAPGTSPRIAVSAAAAEYLAGLAADARLATIPPVRISSPRPSCADRSCRVSFDREVGETDAVQDVGALRVVVDAATCERYAALALEATTSARGTALRVHADPRDDGPPTATGATP